MNIKPTLPLGVFAMLAPCLASADVLSAVTATQDAESRQITVTYTLSEPAIVTPEIVVDGAVDADTPVRAAWGEINRKLAAGTHAFVWQPQGDWPAGRDAAVARIAVRAWPLDAPPDYMVVNLLKAEDVAYYASAESVPEGVRANCYLDERLVLRKIPAAGQRYRMGSRGEEEGRIAAREIPHYVTLTNDFYIGIYPVTRGHYIRVTEEIGSTANYQGENAGFPKLGASFGNMRGEGSAYDWPSAGHAVAASSFLGRLRARAGLDLFDLPTEAEWEFACRAGTNVSALYDEGPVSELGWFSGSDFSSHGGTGTVREQLCGLLRPNAWGLYDMLGNCYEFCLDWYSENAAFAVADSEVTAPVGPLSNAAGRRVTRGGSYKNDASALRCAFRSYDTVAGYYLTGYRVAGRADVSNGAATFARAESKGASIAAFDLAGGDVGVAVLASFDSLSRHAMSTAGMNFRSTRADFLLIIR